MANINGTNKADYLLGTIGGDTIQGNRGNDWIEGGKGDDFLLGDNGSPLHDDGQDTFVLRNGDGHDQVGDYQTGEDFVLFDSGTGVYDGLLAAFQTGATLADGDTFTNSQNSALWTVHFVDENANGILDTEIVMSVGGVDVSSITLLDTTSVLASDILGG